MEKFLLNFVYLVSTFFMIYKHTASNKRPSFDALYGTGVCFISQLKEVKKLIYDVHRKL